MLLQHLIMNYGPRDFHAEGSKSDREKKNMISPLCEILRNGTDEPIYKTETESQM